MLQRLTTREEFLGMTDRTCASKREKYWPTPRAMDLKGNGSSPSELLRNSETLATCAGGKLSPMWVEWLMGFPAGWTDLEDSATQ
jgi:hypothetical protein